MYIYGCAFDAVHPTLFVRHHSDLVFCRYQSFFRLMRFIVNSPRLLVCASKDGIMPFIAHGDWRKGEGKGAAFFFCDCDTLHGK